ncbi:MAG: hypothetical protein IJ192_05910 [Clostridia bacterium]|nr:hypothetical protein [Clostridia bacterium]
MMKKLLYVLSAVLILSASACANHSNSTEQQNSVPYEIASKLISEENNSNESSEAWEINSSSEVNKETFQKLSDKDPENFKFSADIESTMNGGGLIETYEITKKESISKIWDFICFLESGEPVKLNKNGSMPVQNNYLTIEDKTTGEKYIIFQGIYYEDESVEGGPVYFAIDGLSNNDFDYTCYSGDTDKFDEMLLQLAENNG